MSTAPVSKARFYGGWVLGGLPALMLLLDGALKLVKPEFVVKATTELGFSEAAIVPMGAALCVAVLAYLIPVTAPVGAILITGYLGGAVATHVHAGHGPFEVLFPAVFGALIWFGLALRDARVGAAIFRRD